MSSSHAPSHASVGPAHEFSSSVSHHALATGGLGDELIDFALGFIIGYNLTSHAEVYGSHAAAFTSHGVFNMHGVNVGHAQHYHGIFGTTLLGRLLMRPWDDGRNAAIQLALMQAPSIVLHRAGIGVWPQKRLLKIFEDKCHEVGLIKISDSPNVNGDYQRSEKLDSWDFARPNADIWPSSYLPGMQGYTERAVEVYGLPPKIHYCPVLCQLANRVLGRRHLVNRDGYIRERATFFDLIWHNELYDSNRRLRPIDTELKFGALFRADYESKGDAYITSPQCAQRMVLLQAAFAEVFRRFWLAISNVPTPEQVELRREYMARFGLKGPWHPEGLTEWDEGQIDEIKDAMFTLIVARDVQAVRDAGLAVTPGTIPPPEPGLGTEPDLSQGGGDPIAVPPP